jgi:hypothetical protein
MIKGAIDVEKEIIALGGEFHIDASALLLENGSTKDNVWGFNIILDKQKDSPDWIEYLALINIKPNQNRSMEIENKEVRQKIRKILENLIINN